LSLTAVTGVLHPGDEIMHLSSKSNKVSKLCHLISNCVYWPTLCYTCKWWHALKQQCRRP